MVRMPTYDKRRLTARKGSRARASRPKTFKTEEAAKTYAANKGIAKFKLVDISVTKTKQKIRVVAEE